MNLGAGASRLLLGNLDCEDELSLLTRSPRGGRPPLRHPWTRAALAGAAGAATLLRAFSRPGDRLWTPAPVAADRLAAVPGLPRPALETGPLSGLRAGDGLLAWCETPAVRAIRASTPEAAGTRPGAEKAFESAALPLHDLLWTLPAAPPAVVAAVNHRAFCLEIQERLGCALPGASMVGSLAALDALLAGGVGGAPGGAGGASWVVKAPHSAAGRSRAIHRHDLAPAGLARPELRRRVEKLFERHGPLLFEPWMERTADLGVAGLVLPREVRWVGFHRQSVDVRGQFTGVEVGAGAVGAAGAMGMSAIEGLSSADRERWQETLEAVAGALVRAGYVGPFGIDAWRYRDRDGANKLQALGEINARMTFGLIARALVERLREPLGLESGDRVRLAFGRGVPAVESSAIEVLPLLLAGGPGATAAWLEISRRGSASA